MKVMQKYFLAILPPAPFFEQVELIKHTLKDRFGIKYALKSPPHITVKMPFSFDENREYWLLDNLKGLLHDFNSFEIKVSGIGRFRNRVIYLSVGVSNPLLRFQSSVKDFCRVRLHLNEELSDKNYTPHMTVAFKDIKPLRFDEIYSSLENESIDFSWTVSQLCLLKKIKGRWTPVHFISLGPKN